MDQLQKDIEAYRDEHWDEVISDIESLVSIESVEDLAAARPGAPFGPGPREALDRALSIAARMGLETHDCEGYVGYADLPGASDEQVGIIGHVDVVPAGSAGWAYEPYALTRREGYLIGRGVLDDKGPLMVALHAVKFWRDRCASRGEQLPRTIRVLFGANEETNMKDVDYYRAHHDDPSFLFTPDSRFPLGYGESGICSGTLESGLLVDGRICAIAGGQAVNAVPSVARAEVRAGSQGPSRDCASARVIEAGGVAAHASTPELGDNAIGNLVNELLDQGVGTPEERAFLELLKALHDHSDGSGLGIACADDDFGALTAVGGMISLADEPGGKRIRQTIDFRYPTTITAEEIAARVNERAAAIGATFTMEHDKQPFLMDPDSRDVRALLDAYRLVTGEDAVGTTSKGGTYARCFTTGVSFGVEKPWVAVPSWVGGMHGPDEGVSEVLLKQSFAIYARAIGNLMGC